MSAPIAHAHHAPQGFIKKYVFSLDHKVIGLQYYFLGLFSMLIGMTLSVLMRFHMVHPDAKVSFFASLWPKAAAGGVMTPELYLSLMTMHGTIMVFSCSPPCRRAASAITSCRSRLAPKTWLSRC